MISFQTQTTQFVALSVIYEALNDKPLADHIHGFVNDSEFCFGTNNRTLVSVRNFIEVAEEAIRERYLSEAQTKDWHRVRDDLYALDRVHTEFYVDLEN